MANTLAKWVITIVMTLLIPVTGIIYWGATNSRGKLCIVLIGVLTYTGLAFWYSWLERWPKSFADWLEN